MTTMELTLAAFLKPVVLIIGMIVIGYVVFSIYEYFILNVIRPLSKENRGWRRELKA